MGKFWEGFRKLADTITVWTWVSSLGTGMGTGIWSYINSLRAPEIFVLSLAACVAVFVLLLLGLKLSLFIQRIRRKESIIGREKDGVKFYRNRPSMITDTGGLVREVSPTQTSWLSAPTGIYAANTEAFRTRRISRLILIDPNGSHCKTFASSFDRSLDEIASEIRTTTQRAQNGGCEVRWFDGHVPGILVANPDEGVSWIRVEMIIPFGGVDDRPGFRIDKSNDPELFSMFKRSFDTLWDKAKLVKIESN